MECNCVNRKLGCGGKGGSLELVISKNSGEVESGGILGK